MKTLKVHVSDLIETINSRLTETDRTFLLSFKRGNPDWDLYPVAGLKDMPAVQWKLMNLKDLIKSNPGKQQRITFKAGDFTL